MRSPRRNERIPYGAKLLYERLRRDYEPVLLAIFIREEVEASRLKQDDTMAYSREFDPMLYFWPVEGQHCFVQMMSGDEKARERLAKALLRDKAAWVSIASWPEGKLRIDHWGDADGYLRDRYGLSPVGAVATPG